MDMNPESWLDDHGDALFGYARARVRDPHTAEELVQETLLTAIDKRDDFAGRSAVRTWLIGILKHKILQHYRVQSREQPIADELPSSVLDDQFKKNGYWKQWPQKWRGDPIPLAESQEFRRVLERCLSRLPARLREAFLLAEQHDHSAQDLGKILDATATNVYVMLHRARTALRRCLEENWFRAGSGKEE